MRRLSARGVNTTVIQLLAMGLLLPLGCGGTAPNESAEEIGQTSAAVTSNIIWNDEFDSATLDRSKWVASDGAINNVYGADPNNSGSCFNSEKQSYKDIEGCGAGTSTICQYNGYLHLVARYWANAPSTCGYTQNFVSSRLTTKTKFHVNPGLGNNGVRIEARINMPQMTTGVFPAFWMLGADIKQWPSPGSTYWPQAGEIDISEWGSAWPNNQSLATLHYSTQDPSTFDGQFHQQIGSYYTAATVPDAFHTYAVEWTWSTIKWFFDGAQVGPTVDLNATPSQDFNHDFAIILNNAIGGPGGGGNEMNPALAPQSTSSTGAGFDPHQRMAVDYVRVYALNNDGGWTKRVFQGTGQSNAALPTEWDTGYYKGDCGNSAALTGISTNTSGGTPHALLCTNHGGQFTGNGVATVGDVANGEHHRYTRIADWDSGYYKSECGTNEYVSGVSQSPSSGNVHGLRCASASMTSNGTANCETRLVSQEDRGYTGSGDWDGGYYKGECPWGKVVVGVSASPSSGKPHRILCCSK